MNIPLLLLLGCVSKGDYELIQVQLDATRTALSAKNASCYEASEHGQAQLAALERELEASRGRLQSLDDRHQQLLSELAEARAQLAELITTCRVPVAEEIAPAPPVRRRRGCPEPPEPAPPLVQAAAEEVVEALALRSRSLYELEQDKVAHQAWLLAFTPLIDEGRATLHLNQGRSMLRIPAVQIFNEGRVSISPRGELLIATLGERLSGSEGFHIQVGAHSDDLPLHTAEHASSWELCFDQALTVVRALEQAGVPASMSAASFAGQQPIASNETPEGRKRNQRIELVLVPKVGEVVAPVETSEPEEPAQAPAPAESGGGEGG
jgi:chemotaxis protein MotB